MCFDLVLFVPLSRSRISERLLNDLQFPRTKRECVESKSHGRKQHSPAPGLNSMVIVVENPLDAFHITLGLVG